MFFPSGNSQCSDREHLKWLCRCALECTPVCSCCISGTKQSRREKHLPALPDKSSPDPGRQWEDQYFVPIFVGLLPFPIFPSCFVQDASADISEVVYFGAVCSFFRPSELNFISAKHHIKCWKRNLFCFEWESQWLHCKLAFWWHFPNGCASEHGYVYFLSHQSRIPPAGKSVLLVQFVLNNVNSIQSKRTCARLQETVRQRGLFMCVCLYHTAKCHRIGCTDMLVCVPQKDTFCWYLVWRGMSLETGEVQHLSAASGGEKRACEHGKQLLQNLHPSKCRWSWVCSFWWCKIIN